MASWPPLLRADACAAMLNFEIADHLVYDGLELQWFGDAAHGTGMLAFLGRRDSHVFDYYAQRGLRLDPADYQIGAGTGAWVETDIADALLEISDDGVHAAALFTDVDGRRIEVRIDDRDGRRRRRGGLLAPVSASIESPSSLFLVRLPAFDLVRTGGHPPVLRVGDADLRVGRLPGAGLHRRRLIKYAAPVVSIQVLPDPRSDGPRNSSRQALLPTVSPRPRWTAAPSGWCSTPLPDLTALPDGARRDGSWSVSADGGRLTGGRWFVERDGDQVQAGLDVTERWRPRRLPLLMRVVTTVVPVFRRWPTTYRWRAVLGPGGETTGGWTRVGSAGGETTVGPPAPDQSRTWLAGAPQQRQDAMRFGQYAEQRAHIGKCVDAGEARYSPVPVTGVPLPAESRTEPSTGLRCGGGPTRCGWRLRRGRAGAVAVTPRPGRGSCGSWLPR